MDEPGSIGTYVVPAAPNGRAEAVGFALMHAVWVLTTDDGAQAINPLLLVPEPGQVRVDVWHGGAGGELATALRRHRDTFAQRPWTVVVFASTVLWPSPTGEPVETEAFLAEWTGSGASGMFVLRWKRDEDGRVGFTWPPVSVDGKRLRPPSEADGVDLRRGADLHQSVKGQLSEH